MKYLNFSKEVRRLSIDSITAGKMMVMSASCVDIPFVIRNDQGPGFVDKGFYQRERTEAVLQGVLISLRKNKTIWKQNLMSLASYMNLFT